MVSLIPLQKNQTMRQIISIILCLAAIIAGQAQIKGVVNDTSGNSVEFANVTLWQDSTFIAGTVSGSNGSFSFAEKDSFGNKIRVHIIGFAPYEKELQYSDTNLSIILEPIAATLDEVVVTAITPSHKLVAGGISTKVQNTTLSLLGNAMDVIAQQPGVRIDDGNIEVFGKGTPEIFLNGRKLNNYTELSQLSSKEIDNIEVISNPGAKYGAEVRSVIRIKTIRKQGDGLSGSFSTGARPLSCA